MTQSTPPSYTPQPPLSPSDERLWATLTHVGGIFFGFVPSLIVYLVLKDRSQFVAEHAKTALNFQITMAIAYVAGWILSIVLIGLFLVIAVAIVVLVFSIIAAIAANKGELYKYPLTIPLIK